MAREAHRSIRRPCRRDPLPHNQGTLPLTVARDLPIGPVPAAIGGHRHVQPPRHLFGVGPTTAVAYVGGTGRRGGNGGRGLLAAPGLDPWHLPGPGCVTRVEEGRGGILDMLAATRVDINLASNDLEHILLDRSAKPTNLPLSLLQHITGNFAEDRIIGRGGFGDVYKGDLQKGSVAVKRLSNSHKIEDEAFNREAISLLSVKHKNIVWFLGYCANTESKATRYPESGSNYVFAKMRERLLCFEYINNGNLHKYITDELRGLEWHTRYQIICGICDGLAYLHKEKGIVHRDIKPVNIPLDDLMIPKITDFGISKLLDGVTHIVTSKFMYSPGYCAPEMLNSCVVSIKTDIYSLGVIMKEMVTGCKNHPDIKNVLRRWRYRWNKSVNYPPFGCEQVAKCIKIALSCLSESPKKRPDISDIVNMLNTMESANEHIEDAGDSPVGTISLYTWELLELDTLELNFAFEINKQIPCSLQLTNVTDAYVAFAVKTKGELRYCIEPEKSVVAPRSKCNVMVTLQAREWAPDATMLKDEFFSIRCVAVSEGVMAEDLSQEMFKMKPGQVVDKVKLKVVLLIPSPLPPKEPKLFAVSSS